MKLRKIRRTNKRVRGDYVTTSLSLTQEEDAMAREIQQDKQLRSFSACIGYCIKYTKGAE